MCDVDTHSNRALCLLWRMISLSHSVRMEERVTQYFEFFFSVFKKKRFSSKEVYRQNRLTPRHKSQKERYVAESSSTEMFRSHICSQGVSERWRMITQRTARRRHRLPRRRQKPYFAKYFHVYYYCYYTPKITYEWTLLFVHSQFAVRCVFFPRWMYANNNRIYIFSIARPLSLLALVELPQNFISFVVFHQHMTFFLSFFFSFCLLSRSTRCGTHSIYAIVRPGSSPRISCMENECYVMNLY